MQVKQIFGWTDPETPPASKGYVGYLQAHAHPCDTIMIALRPHESPDGVPVVLAIPLDAGIDLARSIYALANEINYPPDNPPETKGEAE